MNRREALRILMAGAALPLLPHKALASMREARLLVGLPETPRTLNPHQFATVKTMAEMILPKSDTPGAADVGATEFIDLILTEWYVDDERARFLGGLANVDRRTQSLFSKDFVDASAAQQADILTALGVEIVESAQSQNHSPRNRGSAPQASDNFYLMLRRLTMIAYYTSEAGATQELKFEMIPDHFDGCTPMQTSVAAKEGSGRGR
jgi:hypothetical protein